MQRLRKYHAVVPPNLREVETNRLVRTADVDDEVIYRALLRRDDNPEWLNGIVRGDPWGESGWVYLAPPAVC